MIQLLITVYSGTCFGEQKDEISGKSLIFVVIITLIIQKIKELELQADKVVPVNGSDHHQ